MHERTHANWKRQRGFTLSEILVAVAIFTIIVVAALLLYDRSNKVFKQANEAAEMQQNTRVAFEKIVSEVRMAGFDYKRAGTPAAGNPSPWVANRDYNVGSLVTPTVPNGHVYAAITPGVSGGTEPAWLTTPTGVEIPGDGAVTWKEAGAPVYEQPDEQIEYAGTAAITIRGNFDYNVNAGATNNGRESDLEVASGGRFPVITTGNDEIVTYALKSADPDKNDDSISFFADVNAGGTPNRTAYPGGSAEREIIINEVDLSNANPPYTLVRFTLNADGSVQETPLADNIRSLNFDYWEDYGATIQLKDLAGADIEEIGGAGPYDPAAAGATVPGRIIRSKIRAVTVTLTGMNPQADPTYRHPTDAIARNFRQYELQSTIVGRNLGVKGVPQSNTNPPGAPTLDNACTGYCGVAVVRWTPAAGTVDTTYTVLWDTAEDGSFSRALPAGSQTHYAIDFTQEDFDTETFFIKVAATNAAGTTISNDTIEVSPKNSTKPAAPGGLGATVGTAAAPIPNQITLTWEAPSTNASGSASCSPSGTPPYTGMVGAELRGFRIYRSTNNPFNITDAGVQLIYEEDDSGAITDGDGTWTYLDTDVENCQQYHYRIVAVEWCAAAAAMNTTGDAATGLSDPSAIVTGMAYNASQAAAPQNLKIDPFFECDPAGNTCTNIKLTWDPVVRDQAGNAITIKDYVITRQKKKGVLNIGAPVERTIEDGTTTFVEPDALEEHDVVDLVTYSYEYTVRAPYCSLPGASATILFPPACETVADIAPSATGGSGLTFEDPWTDLEAVTITEHPARPLASVQVSIDGGALENVAGPSPFVIAWDDTGDGLVHFMTIRLESESGCVETKTFYVQNDIPACSVSGRVVNVAGSTTQLDIFIVNLIDEPLNIDNFTIAWRGQTGFAWNSITLPSGAVMTAPGTATTARAVTFTPGVTIPASDKTVPANGSLRVRMNFTATGGVADATTVTDFVLDYRRASVGTFLIECSLSPLTKCSVRSAVTAVTGNQFALDITITNSSVEELALRRISITWAGQNKLQWTGITLRPSAGGPTIPVSPALATDVGGTRTFTLPAGEIIAPGGTYVVRMNLPRSQSGAQQAETTRVSNVVLEYTTEGGGTTALTCRAQ